MSSSNHGSNNHRKSGRFLRCTPRRLLPVGTAVVGSLETWTNVSGIADGSCIHKVAVSPCHTWVAAATDDSRIPLWKSCIQPAVFLLEGHQRRVVAVVWSSRSRLASASSDGVVKIWNVATRQCLQTWKGAEWVYSLAWCGGRSSNRAAEEDEECLAAGTADGEICVWRATTGHLVRRWKAHSSWVFALAWNQRESVLATGGSDGQLILWTDVLVPTSKRAPNKVVLQQGKGHSKCVWTVAWSQSNRYLASGSDQSICVWGALPPPSFKNAVDGGCSAQLECWGLLFVLPQEGKNWSGTIRSLEWLGDVWLASGSINGAIRVWHVPSRTCRGSYWSQHSKRTPHDDHNDHNENNSHPPRRRAAVVGVNSVAWGDRGGCLLSGSEDGTLQQWYGISDVLLHETLYQLSNTVGRALEAKTGSDDKEIGAVEDNLQQHPPLGLLDQTLRIVSTWLDDLYS